MKNLIIKNTKPVLMGVFSKNIIRVIYITSHLASLILVFVLTSHLSLPTSAHAQQQTLKVSPVIINVTLSPGKTYTQPVAIENLSDSPLPLRTALSDFMTGGEEGGYVFAETKSNPLLSWIKLDETEFILNPKEKKELQMMITTPDAIPVGGYYGVLFFEPVAQGDQSSSTKVNAKVGVLMLANIGVPDPNAKKAEILTYETDFLHADGNISVLLRVKNTSLNFFSAKPTVHITPLLPVETTIREYPLEEKIIFPGNIRRWEEAATIQSLPPNIYKATVNISTGNGQVISAEKYLIVLPPSNILIGVFLLFLLVFIITKRKRIKNALAALK